MPRATGLPKRYGTPDAESPAWTREEFARAQRAGDVFPTGVVGEAPPTRVRGPQIAAEAVKRISKGGRPRTHDA